MEFKISTQPLPAQHSDCIVVGIFEDGLSLEAQQLDKASKGFIKKVLHQGDITGKSEQTLLLHQVPHLKATRLLLIGCGKTKDLDERQYFKLMQRIHQSLKPLAVKNVTVCALNWSVKNRDLAWQARQWVQFTEGFYYRFDAYKTSSKTKDVPKLRSLSFAIATKVDKSRVATSIREGQAIAKGMTLTRTLGNLPPNHCTPTYLANQAKIIAQDYSNIKVQVLDKKQMQTLGMGALLAVAAGSTQPPKLIVLDYQGAKEKTKPYVLVGKGITFDSGGISLKPGAAMDEMKFDMCGAASVLGTLVAAAELKLPLNIIGIIAASENMPSGSAAKPGDIVKTMSGETVEILNTDAEGRLVLCDALTYAGKYNPKVVIDIATLTGACIVALGYHTSGLLGNNDTLIQALLKAGQTGSDKAWQLPLWDDYQEHLDSNFADIANIGTPSGAGTITAACFLSRFTKSYEWAHLDVAGTAWKSGKEKGATGRPVPLLTQFLLDQCKN